MTDTIKEVGGTHYKQFRDEPIALIQDLQLPFAAGCIVKYICRYPFKGGISDIQKAVSLLPLLPQTSRLRPPEEEAKPKRWAFLRPPVENAFTAPEQQEESARIAARVAAFIAANRFQLSTLQALALSELLLPGGEVPLETLLADLRACCEGEEQHLKEKYEQYAAGEKACEEAVKALELAAAVENETKKSESENG